MSHKPLVSVIIIFLNEEKFLQEAIDSVLTQTYDNWELLLVDDGSTDNSTKIALAHAQSYSAKVRYLEHEGHQNRGMSASRNLGLLHAKGKYISPLDGDDVWLPRKLEQQVAILESQPEAAMVFGPLQLWYSWTGNPEDIDRDCLYNVGVGNVHPYANTLVQPPKILALFLRHEHFIPAGVLVHRNIIERVGGGEDIFRGSYEDTVVHVKVCLNSAVFVSSECWYKYRIHPNSWQRVVIKTGQVNSTRLFYLNWVEEYLSKQGVKDPEVWQSLRHALWPYRHPRLYRLRESYRHFKKQIKELVKLVGRRTLPISVRHWLRTKLQAYLQQNPI